MAYRHLTSYVETAQPSGDYIAKVTAEGTNMKLYVDGGEKDSVALAGASVPDNANPIVFAANGTMPYVDYLKVTVNDTLEQHLTWQDAATLTDQSGQDNHPTSVSFRTASTDGDVSASLLSFGPAQLSATPALNVSS